MSYRTESSTPDHDMLPEYDFSTGVRGKHAHRVEKPYSVTIQHSDGTATIQEFDGKNNMISERYISAVEQAIEADKVWDR